MKIVIATPLYPPETAKSALYVKELAKRLSKNNRVNVVFYGHLPEKVPGVIFTCVEKSVPLPLRLFCFFTALWKAALRADIIYAENGASVELPAGLVALFTRRPMVIHFGDCAAKQKAEKKILLRCIKYFVTKKAKQIINDSPLARPEIMPFGPKPQKEIDKYEKSWKTHLKKLKDIFRDILHE